MTNENVNTTNQANNGYFNGVLYARVRINEVKLIQPKSKHAKQYCAINATILGLEDDKKTYTNIDLIVKGHKAKKVLWELEQQWPINRFEQDENNKWFADVNIGSISHCGFEKRNKKAGATLKGRLINIRSLKINNDVVVGEQNNESPNPAFVSPAYINLIEKGKAKASLLEGKVGDHDYQNINLSYDDIDVFTELESQGLCPKGYKYRDTNAKIFAILELSKIEAIGFKDDDGEFKSYLSGKLAKVRYLKANDQVLTKKLVTEESAEISEKESDIENAA